MRGLGNRYVAQRLADAANPIQIGRTDIVLLAVPLQQEADAAIGACRFLQGSDGRRTPYRERGDRSREQNGVAQRDDDERIVRDRLGLDRLALDRRRGRADARGFFRCFVRLLLPDAHAVSFPGKVGMTRRFCKPLRCSAAVDLPMPRRDMQA